MENGVGRGDGSKGRVLSEKGVLPSSRGLKPLEALERLLSYAVREKDLPEVSSSLMKKFKGLRGVLDASHEELSQRALLTRGARPS